MAETVPDHQTAIDRRSFMLGRAAQRRTAAAPAPADIAPADIASVLVQTRPEHLVAVATAICALTGCEIHARDPKGKLVVVIEAPDAGAVGATLNTIAMTRNVLSAALVFHAVDAG
jgi:nitrate reductase NapD